MSDQEIWEALESIFAYDTGSTDTGVHDEALRQRCKDQVAAMTDKQMSLSLSRFLRDAYLSEEALSDGYGVEAVHDFLEWLGEQGVWEF